MTAQGTKTAAIPVEALITESQFLSLAEQLPDWTLEYSVEEGLTFMPPTDPLTSRRNSLIVYRLSAWAEGGSGIVSGPDGGFLLPDGARLAPDAAWFNEARYQAAQVPGVRFPLFVPEFVIELRSPSDRRYKLEDKMQSWMKNGVALGWLVDPLERSVTVYRPALAPEVLANPVEVRGEGPVAGFTLTLDRILS